MSSSKPSVRQILAELVASVSSFVEIWRSFLPCFALKKIANCAKISSLQILPFAKILDKSGEERTYSPSSHIFNAHAWVWPFLLLVSPSTQAPDRFRGAERVAARPDSQSPSRGGRRCPMAITMAIRTRAPTNRRREKGGRHETRAGPRQPPHRSADRDPSDAGTLPRPSDAVLEADSCVDHPAYGVTRITHESTE